MVQRLTYRRRNSYRTKGNKIHAVRTPGGVLSAHYIPKSSSIPKCGDCGNQLHGIPAVRPKEYRTLKKRQRSVSRAYGGSRCFACVRDRIVRAFLVEEQKLVKAMRVQREKVLAAKAKKAAKGNKKSKKKSRR
mmetsp:Transcript_23676/g.42970  ORF Transcript_23676/g.42970 Transcript_23676/m.42970 type:complete len:133 (-) Transcript_23676:58-456(-)|eukprot:CAMPEP_0202486286 /NCGR_PEP_ID=MMETSP1361-20130828/4892_1 /ASSEMBLY_ACC=CAM_ASM_000849 /TAXON_ID=210615 /ORGANISM="Staurosira complex sp., Strain CCMP2646" /LENGTH=132 /DNA_ID=CAMNT_0049115369 /DNA_START=21 /DNA_END=419 /DNA_ORIENTATION=+